MSCEQPLLENEPIQDPAAPKSELQKTAFDRTIATIHDFVMFLKDLYILEEAILVPPSEGWPEITKEFWFSLGKFDEVIEVLRHLTYITRNRMYQYQFIPDSALYDFRSFTDVDKVTSGKRREIAYVTEVVDEPAPSYVVGIVRGGRSSQIILLDCRKGTVCDCGTMETEGKAEEQPVEEYFMMLKEQFRHMELLPSSDYEVSKEGVEDDRVFKPLKEIFKKHGWPDAYNKRNCVAEVTEFGRPRNKLRLVGYCDDTVA